MKLFEMKHIKKSFGALDVLRDISLEVDKGEVLSIIGPSGSKADVGSSKKRISGFMQRALAMETLCCCPPESWYG